MNYVKNKLLKDVKKFPNECKNFDTMLNDRKKLKEENQLSFLKKDQLTNTNFNYKNKKEKLNIKTKNITPLKMLKGK
jgi:hypothetical protein